MNENKKASFDQEKTRIEIPTFKAAEDEENNPIMDAICGSGENRIMFRYVTVTILTILSTHFNCLQTQSLMVFVW